MKIIITVFKKELKHTLRDKKTLFSAIILPILIFPLLLWVVFVLEKNLLNKEENKKLKIVMIGNDSVLNKQFQDSKFIILKNYNFEASKNAIIKDSIDAIIDIPANFSNAIDDMKGAVIRLYYKSTNLYLYSRIFDKIEQLNSQLLHDRIKKLHLTEEVLKPITILQNNIATPKEKIGKTIGGLLPYIFILFCFMSSMYPTIDLITGEKEKGTIETLLTTPVSRLNILLGKIMAIACIGLCSALMIILGMIFCLGIFADIPEELKNSMQEILTPKVVFMILAMLLPLSLFFAGLLSSIAVHAKNFKEAQSTITPLSFVILIPAMIALMPGIELNWQNAIIPILNIALGTKEILAGTILPSHFLLIIASLVIISFLVTLMSYKQYSKENVI